MGKALLIVVMLAAVPASAGEEDFDADVLSLLEQRSPEAVSVYREAEQARQAGDPGRAAEGYRRVLELAPHFSHALRRLCQAEAELGDRGAAVAHCRRAVALERSADNLATLAMVLVNMGEGGEPAAVREALQLSRDAVRVDPISVQSQGVLCQVAILANEVATLGRCVEQLERIAADDWMTHMFAASLAIAQERWGDARAALGRSSKLGLPKPLYAEIDATISSHEPLLPPWLLFITIAGGLFLLALVVLVVLRSRRKPSA